MKINQINVTVEVRDQEACRTLRLANAALHSTFDWQEIVRGWIERWIRASQRSVLIVIRLFELLYHMYVCLALSHIDVHPVVDSTFSL
jgi:hypothetical protein